MKKRINDPVNNPVNDLVNFDLNITKKCGKLNRKRSILNIVVI